MRPLAGLIKEMLEQEEAAGFPTYHREQRRKAAQVVYDKEMHKIWQQYWEEREPLEDRKRAAEDAAFERFVAAQKEGP